MTHYFLIKLSEKVKSCNPKQIKDFDFDFDFEYDSLTERSAAAWFTIHTMPIEEDFNVKIENNKVYLAQGDANLFQIGGEDAENWKALAYDLFQERYAQEIEDLKREDAFDSWIDFQDDMGEIQRHAI